MHSPSKVPQLQLPFHPDEDILRLDVTMDDLFRMTVDEGVCQLVDKRRSPAKKKSVQESSFKSYFWTRNAHAVNFLHFHEAWL
jgi:hypothetical protein